MAISAFVGSQAHAINLSQNFNFDGTLVNDTTGVAMTGPVSIKFQIYDPTAACLLFEETQSNVPLTAAGAFSVKIGNGARASASVDGGLALAKIFQNDGTVRTSGTNCSSPYTPAAGDDRKLRVTVNAIALTPDYSMSPVPMASVAETLQGKSATDFVSSTSASSMVGPLTMTSNGVIKFTDASVNYVSLRAPAALGAPVNLVLPANAGINGYCLTTDGTGILGWSVCGGGSPTGAAGGDLTGTYPNPSLSASGVTAGTYSKLTVDTKGRVTAGLALATTDLAALSFGAGDLGGTFGAPTVTKLQGYPVAPSTPLTGYVLKFTAGSWTPSTFTDFTGGGSVTSGALNIGSSSSFTTTAGSSSTFSGTATFNGATNFAGTANFATTNYSGNATFTNGFTLGSSAIGAFPVGSVSAPPLMVGPMGLFYDGGTPALGFASGGAEKMRISSSGNVGIGTTAPAQKLDVVGSVRTSISIMNISAAPTISACGTSPPVATVGSNNNSGQFTLGTGVPTTCTVTLANPFPTNAFCTVTPASNYAGTYYISTQTNSAFIVTLGTGTPSVKFNYTCNGN